MTKQAAIKYLESLSQYPTLVAAFNAYGVVIDEDFHAQMFDFHEEYSGSIFKMAKRLDVNAENFAVEWMSFCNESLYFLPGY